MNSFAGLAGWRDQCFSLLCLISHIWGIERNPNKGWDANRRSYQLALGETLICERCSNQVYYVENCDYCKKAVCLSCEKSAKRLKKIRRLVICKACWGNMKARKQFKAM